MGVYVVGVMAHRRGFPRSGGYGRVRHAVSMARAAPDSQSRCADNVFWRRTGVP